MDNVQLQDQLNSEMGAEDLRRNTAEEYDTEHHIAQIEGDAQKGTQQAQLKASLARGGRQGAKRQAQVSRTNASKSFLSPIAEADGEAIDRLPDMLAIEDMKPEDTLKQNKFGEG